MNTFIKTVKQNKILHILSILIIITFIVLVTRITYAYLAPNINDAFGNITTTSDTVDDFKLELGKPLTVNATPTTLPENGSNLATTSVQTAKLKANSTKNTATFNYYVYLEITNNTFTYSSGTTPEIILTITDPTGTEITALGSLTYGTYNGVSGFDITTQTGLFTIADNYEITSTSSKTYTEQDWTITITYLNLNIDQSGNYGNSLDTKVYMTKESKIKTIAEMCSDGQSLSSCITSMYGMDANLYYHDSSLENGANDNSYRYAGASDVVNNYVCFGSDETTCPVDNLYRIIGVFDGRVKLIKADYVTSTLLGTDGDYKGNHPSYSTSYYKGSLSISDIGEYYWNYNGLTDHTGDNKYGSNVWSTSLLNKTNLNTNYLNNIGSKWANLIDTTTWKVGGNTEFRNQIPSVAYQNEIVNPASSTTYEAKVGLMYASDYGFAADPSAWTTTLLGYDSSSITSKNWIYMGLTEWTISPYSSSLYVFYVSSNGYLTDLSANNGSSVRPVSYLSASVKYNQGSGTKNDPVRINL